MFRPLLFLLLLFPCALHAETFTFGLFGDTPYNDWERAQFPALMAQMDAEDLAFVIHDGDFKSGIGPCSDAVFRDRLALFKASRHPLVFVPGDNEWSDCHRFSSGSHAQLERLARLRELFFADDYALGQRRLRLERQSSDPAFAAYRENVRWQMGVPGAGVLFVGLNAPGGDNNYAGEHFGGGPVAEFIERQRANLAWLTSSFAQARERRLAGILLVIQANPGFDADAKGQPQPGFREFLARLRAETRGFAGQVVLVHGDSHTQRIDQPLRDPHTRQRIANFTRVETFGSPKIGWVKGFADPQEPKVFRFEAKPYRLNPY